MTEEQNINTEPKRDCPFCHKSDGLFRCSQGALNCSNCMQFIPEKINDPTEAKAESWEEEWENFFFYNFGNLYLEETPNTKHNQCDKIKSFIATQKEKWEKEAREEEREKIKKWIMPNSITEVCKCGMTKPLVLREELLKFLED